MTPKEAENVLARRKKRATGKRGPSPLGFTVPEKQAVRILTQHRRTQAQIADLSGLSLRSYHNALEKDSELQFAQQLGRDDRVLEVAGRLERIAKDKQHRGQMRAIELLLKMDDEIGEARARIAQTNVTVNVNEGSAHKAIDGRTYIAGLKKINRPAAGPSLIEHEPEQAVIIDPITAVKNRRTDT